MKESTIDTLVEIRDIINRIHDNHVSNRIRNGTSGLSILEMAAIRDTANRINLILDELAKEPKQ